MTPTDAELAQHLRGASAPADARRIEEWLAESDDHRRRMEELRTIWNTTGQERRTDLDALWTGIALRTTLADAPRQARPAPIPRLSLAPAAPPRPSLVPVVAALALVLAGAASLLLFDRARSLVNGPSLNSESPRDYTTGRGERSNIQLPDGTRITLAPLTHVAVPAGFGISSREVTIDGEAILDVVRDASRPFRVVIGHAFIQDIGTRFSVRSLGSDGAVTIAVAEGAVALSRNVHSGDAANRVSTVIKAGGVGRLHADGSITSSTAKSLVSYFGWASGRMSFDDIPLAEVQRTLVRWYDVDLRVEDTTLLERRITARFDGQSPHSIVGAIAKEIGTDSVEWRGNVATLRKLAPPSPR